MIRELTLFSLMASLCGCAMLSESGSSPASVSGATHSMTDTPGRATMLASANEIPEQNTLVDYRQIMPGQKFVIRATVSTPEELARGGSLEVTQYFGVIETVDDHQVILRDASVVELTERNTPALSRPFLPHFFQQPKYQESDVQVRPLKHSVVIPRTQIVHAQPFRPGPPERVAIDFERP